jgi:hypothetical protein
MIGRLPLAVALLMGWITFAAHSAEVRCAYEPFTFEKMDAEEESWFTKHYPSGRRPKDNYCSQGYLSGEISKGDYVKVTGFFRSHHPFLTEFALSSPGGDVEEAVKIGRFFRRYLIRAEAPRVRGPPRQRVSSLPLLGSIHPLCRGPSCICASACALIWFGGIERSGSIGLHRPLITDTAFRNLPAAEASLVYRRSLAAIADYLGDMEVPRPIIDGMVATGSAEMRWVEDDNLEQPPSIAEWMNASCGALTNQEKEKHSELMGEDASQLPQQEQLLYKLLHDKWKKKLIVITF